MQGRARGQHQEGRRVRQEVKPPNLPLLCLRNAFDHELGRDKKTQRNTPAALRGCVCLASSSAECLCPLLSRVYPQCLPHAVYSVRFAETAPRFCCGGCSARRGVRACPWLAAGEHRQHRSGQGWRVAVVATPRYQQRRCHHRALFSVSSRACSLGCVGALLHLSSRKRRAPLVFASRGKDGQPLLLLQGDLCIAPRALNARVFFSL